MINENPAKYPVLPSVILTKDESEASRKESWNYIYVVGMLNFFTDCTHPEIAFAVHQCVRFCNNPNWYMNRQ